MHQAVKADTGIRKMNALCCDPRLRAATQGGTLFAFFAGFIGAGITAAGALALRALVFRISIGVGLLGTGTLRRRLLRIVLYRFSCHDI